MTDNASTTTIQHSEQQFPDGVPHYQILDGYWASTADEIVRSVKRRFDYALPYFPELSGKTVTLARLMPETEYPRERGRARADAYNDIIYLEPEIDVGMVTIFHELAHLAIQEDYRAGRDVPITSEGFCSVYAVARMPVDMIDSPWIPYLGEPSVPREDWPEICEQALTYRENHRNYLQQCKEWLDVT